MQPEAIALQISCHCPKNKSTSSRCCAQNHVGHKQSNSVHGNLGSSNRLLGVCAKGMEIRVYVEWGRVGEAYNCHLWQLGQDWLPAVNSPELPCKTNMLCTSRFIMEWWQSRQAQLDLHCYSKIKLSWQSPPLHDGTKHGASVVLSRRPSCGKKSLLWGCLVIGLTCEL